jgi:hypothetical protein
MRNWRSFLGLTVIIAGAVAYGCTSILGLGDYKIGGDASTDDDSGRDASSEAASCDADSNPLNACTNSTCIPFDDKEHIKHPQFTGESKLPPVPDLPPVDSGVPTDSGGGG